mmetsp:Transcript_35822/g.109896  ORF Transcript_35822/g.109896 Transcript_35822/m.109896 type:complete len:110 (-) Transcript_35822:19-348(-)
MIWLSLRRGAAACGRGGAFPARLRSPPGQFMPLASRGELHWFSPLPGAAAVLSRCRGAIAPAAAPRVRAATEHRAQLSAFSGVARPFRVRSRVLATVKESERRIRGSPR